MFSRLKKSEALEILRTAAGSPLGLLLLTNNVNSFVGGLDNARRLEEDPQLASLVFRRVNFPDANLAIIRGPAAKPRAIPVDLPDIGELD